MSADVLAVSADVLAVAADRVSAGPLGLLVVLLMLVTTAFLIRNMNGRLKRMPREFPPAAPPDEDAPPERR